MTANKSAETRKGYGFVESLPRKEVGDGLGVREVWQENWGSKSIADVKDRTGQQKVELLFLLPSPYSAKG